jgi:hypothetical protein
LEEKSGHPLENIGGTSASICIPPTHNKCCPSCGLKAYPQWQSLDWWLQPTHVQAVSSRKEWFNMFNPQNKIQVDWTKLKWNETDAQLRYPSDTASPGCCRQKTAWRWKITN